MTELVLIYLSQMFISEQKENAVIDFGRPIKILVWCKEFAQLLWIRVEEKILLEKLNKVY